MGTPLLPYMFLAQYKTRKEKPVSGLLLSEPANYFEKVPTLYSR